MGGQFYNMEKVIIKFLRKLDVEMSLVQEGWVGGGFVGIWMDGRKVLFEYSLQQSKKLLWLKKDF